MMVCRLCFMDVEDSIEIFPKNGKQTFNNSEVAWTIKKYLDIELKPGDGVSSRICRCCWTKLWDFHEYNLFIIDKQQELLFKPNEPEWIEEYPAPASTPTPQDDIAAEYSIQADCETMVDINVFALCKQHIDESPPETAEQHNDGVSENNDGDMSAGDVLPEFQFAKPKATKEFKKTKKIVIKNQRQGPKRSLEANVESLAKCRKVRVRLRAIDVSSLPIMNTATENKKESKAPKDNGAVD